MLCKASRINVADDLSVPWFRHMLAIRTHKAATIILNVQVPTRHILKKKDFPDELALPSARLNQRGACSKCYQEALGLIEDIK